MEILLPFHHGSFFPNVAHFYHLVVIKTGFCATIRYLLLNSTYIIHVDRVFLTLYRGGNMEIVLLNIASF